MKSILFSLISFLSINVLQAQSFPAGLWKVAKVTVADKEMTPDSRWTRFNEDGSFIAGNGYLRNAEGHYFYRAKEQSILIKDSLGKGDPYGAFKIQIGAEEMLWQRMEEGQLVSVHWKPISKTPRSFSDRLRGNWEGEDGTILFLRWDRAFEMQDSAEGPKSYGVWRNHPHRPELALIPWREEEGTSFWEIEYLDDQSLRLAEKKGERKLSFRRLRD